MYSSEQQALLDGVGGAFSGVGIDRLSFDYMYKLELRMSIEPF
jgi:hypothetical protein